MSAKPSTGKVVFCSILALLLALLLPFITLFGIMLPMSTIGIAMIAAVVFYVSGGLIPACILGVVGTLFCALLLGLVPAAAVALMWFVPAGVIIAGIRGRKPFGSQMGLAVGTSLAASAIALAVMSMVFGSNMIGMAIDQLRKAFDSQKELFWQAAEVMVISSEVKITSEEFYEAYYGMFRTLQNYYEYYLLSNLLNGAVISSVISVFWGNWLSARKGDATGESFVGVSGWYLPSNLTLGMMLVLVAGAILMKTPVAGAKTAWIVVSGICQMVLMIQAFAAMDRRQKKAGVPRGRRIFMIVLMIFLGAVGGSFFGIGLYTLLAIVGAASALFGSKGAAKPLINKIKEQMDKDEF